MKTLYEMFPLELNVEDKLDATGLKLPDTFRFSDVNIVIGENGSGKTRLLRTLKVFYESENMSNSVDLIYGYFPSLSDRFVQKKSELPEYALWEFLVQPDVNFDDFFKEIEAQGADFLSHLLERYSQRQEKANEKTLEKINDFFYPTTGKRLIVSQQIPLEMEHHFWKEDLMSEPRWIAVQEQSGRTYSLTLAIERFSPGERLLLYMAIFFVLKRDSTRKRVIILDEPETHLHPQALLTFIRTLKSSFSHTTIWIATHSLFLLPEFNFENVIYMKDGAVIPRNSGLYENVFSALLGEDNEGTRRFFSSLPYWQYVDFVTECFTTPEVVDTVDPEDEQVQLFMDALKRQQIRKVLDCGGGSGRLGLSLMAAGSPLESYDIFDANPSYIGNEFTVYTDIKDIKNLYDCVVMMNFLHEVEPDDWPELFHEIYGLLETNGNLFFVEVAALRDGEWPNETGYMVLGKSELTTLFNITGDLSEIHIQDKQKSVGVLIPRHALETVTKKTVLATIRRLEARSYAELKEIRSEETERKKSGNGNPPNARRYAFLSQQYINAKLFNDKNHPDQPQYSHTTVSKDDLLTLALRSAKELIMKDPAIDSRLSGSTRCIFKSAVDFYKKNGRITDAQHDRCDEHIEAIERKGARGQTIEKFLILFALMDDKKAVQQLEAYGINPYSPVISTQTGRVQKIK